MTYSADELVPPGLLVRVYTCWRDVNGAMTPGNVDELCGEPAWGVTTTSRNKDFVMVDWLDPRGHYDVEDDCLPDALEWGHDRFTLYAEGEEPDDGLAALAAWRLTT